jgi:hypothetical protein
MNDDDYISKEEAIKFNDQDNNDDDDNDDNNGDDDDDLYIPDVATMEKKRKKGARSKLKSSMSKKWHKSKGTNNTSINHDSVMLSGKGDPDFEGDADGDLEGDADGEDLDEDIDFFEEKRYEKTKAKNWTMHKNGRPGRVIHPIPFTGPAEFFSPNLSDEELKGMVDVHGNIRFSKIIEWMLPLFDGVSFYEFLSARMRNFMLHSIQTKGRTPLYYSPSDGKVISADDVARFFWMSTGAEFEGESINRADLVDTRVT